jgi:hypothetical protein
MVLDNAYSFEAVQVEVLSPEEKVVGKRLSLQMSPLNKKKRSLRVGLQPEMWTLKCIGWKNATLIEKVIHHLVSLNL